MTKNYLPPQIVNLLLFSMALFSILTIVGWIADVPKLIFLFSEKSTMKVNTALCFLVIAFAAKVNHSASSLLQFIKYTGVLIVLFISSSVLIAYLFDTSLFMDNLFVNDIYSAENPGRMSRASALCFLFFSMGLVGTALNNQIIRKGFHFFYVAVLIISFVSSVSHLLAVPMEHKLPFFQTMSVQTSLFLVFLSLILLLRRSVFSFGEFFLSSMTGSRLVRVMMPFVVITPVILNYLLIYFSNKHWVEIDFAIAIGAVIYIIVSIIYVAYFGNRLNKINQRSKKLQRELNQSKQIALKINLLRETHHRVKNNFQLVNSLLRIQSMKLTDEKLISVLEDCQDRIRAMALLHEQLYREGNYEKVQINAFIEAITKPLIDAYKHEKLINLEFKVSPKLMDMNIAIPLGLIINEIITNSLKHAFVGRAEGKIIIELNETNEELYELIIGDDGIGLSTELVSETITEKSMGRELISIFSEQIRAKVERLNRPGTLHRFTFSKQLMH
ncbi:sensor histidine kinase [Crocinitomix algicola]|uniref:sensor histidine kinase n=1 Tax=Crocinitomix algicola TaxID=1740263 RepID=UPI0009F3D6A9|nr:sensor histidine kinase [Crocinitomix algicola]